MTTTRSIVTVTLNPALDVSFEVERMVPESKLRGSAVAYQPGGGGLNVARGATRLGADVEAVWLGGGPNGERLAKLLTAEGIRHRQLAIADDVRMSIHVEERATTDMYRFVLPGASISADEADAVAADVARTEAAFVVMSGSMPPCLPADFYAQLAARAPRDARVIVDTSGDALGHALAGRVFLAKPNKNELGRLCGRTLSTVDDVTAAARELIEAGRVEVLAVSLADEGLVLVTRDTVEHIRAPKVEMVSAVGAGDSTVAGIVTGLARGLALRDAVRLGVASGTAAVLTAGSELFRRDDAERLYAQLTNG